MNIYGSLMDIYDQKNKYIFDQKNKDIYVEKSKKHHPILLSTIQKQAQLEYRTALAIL